MHNIGRGDWRLQLPAHRAPLRCALRYDARMRLLGGDCRWCATATMTVPAYFPVRGFLVILLLTTAVVDSDCNLNHVNGK